MNIKEYISSGVLEAYVLGELPVPEMEEVEKNLAIYPELGEELRRVEEAQESLLLQTAIQPRAAVKTALFSKIESTNSSAKVIAMPSSASASFWKFAAAASVTLAVISSVMAFNYYSKWKNTENSLATLMAQNRQMADAYNVVNQRLDKMDTDMKIVNSPSFQRVVMTGTPAAPESIASVYWNASTEEVYLSIQNMKALSKENQYQLWAIIDGKPVDAGVFDGDLAGLIKMKGIGKGAATFAVTIEPRGGKTSPTLETMQVAGNVVKG